MWWYLHCITTGTLPCRLVWVSLKLIWVDAGVVYSPSSTWFGIHTLVAFLFHWRHHYTPLICILWWWIDCALFHWWVLHFQVAWPIMLVSLYFGAFAVMAFRWACVLGSYVSFCGVIYGKCSLSVVLFHSKGWGILMFLWSEILLSVVPGSQWGVQLCMILAFYGGVTISIDENYERLWFLVSELWHVDVQRHYRVSCSWVYLTDKLVYHCIELWWHPQWLDMPVVFLCVETIDLSCLHMVEYCFRGFTLRRWVVICFLLIWSCILLFHQWFYMLLVHSVHALLLLWFSCDLYFSMSFSPFLDLHLLLKCSFSPHYSIQHP